MKMHDFKESVEGAIEQITRAQLEIAEPNAPDGHSWPLLDRLWDELNDVEKQLKAVRDDDELNEVIEAEDEHMYDLECQADAASF